MERQHEEAIRGVFSEILERLVYIFTEDAEGDELISRKTEFLRVRMHFSGARRGEIILSVDPDLCQEVVANMLGTERDDVRVRDLTRDALKEVLNVICGRILTEIAGREPLFNLSLPVIDTIAQEEWNELVHQSGTMGFLVEDYPVLLQFIITD